MKTETLEQVAERLYPIKYQSYMEDYIDINYDERQGFIKGAKWQQERSYSEEDMLESFMAGIKCESKYGKNFEQFIKQFKKKDYDRRYKKMVE